MTEGTPWKVILRFSIPVLMGNLFQQLYSLADAMIIGRLVGVYPLAGVGAAAAMSFLVLGFATGLTGGFSVVTAQRAGQGDPEKIKESAAASMVLCAVTAVLLTVLSVATAVPLLRFMNTPEEIFPYARTYIRITYLGLGAVLYYNLMAGLLRALGDSRAPLFFLIISSVLNVVLDVIMIRGFHSGVGGAALATVISQLVSAVACHLYAVKRYPVLRPEKRYLKVERREAFAHLRIGVPMALQFSVTAVGIIILQAYLNEYGALVVAGYTAAGKVENLVTQPFNALALAMEVYCGQNMGAGKRERIRCGIRQCIALGTVCVILSSAVNVCLGRPFIGLFMETCDPKIVEYGYVYLVIIAVFFWLLCTMQIMRSSLQGIGEAAVPMAGGILELFSRWAGCAAFSGISGYTGVYLSTPLAWGMALLLLTIRYRWLAGRGFFDDRQQGADPRGDHYADIS